MKIVNPAVQADIQAGRPLRLNLGAGETRRDGFYSVDRLELPGIDIVADLNEPLTLLPDNSVQEIYTRHTLEHVERFLELMEELHRVLRDGGRITAIVPHFSNPHGYSDPTHVRFFGLYSFYYFVDPASQRRRKVPAFYSAARFRVERIRIRFERETFLDKLVGPLLDWKVNLAACLQAFYEKRLCWMIPAGEIHCELRVVKER